MELYLFILDLYHGNTIKNFQDFIDKGIEALIHKCTQYTNFIDDKYFNRKQYWKNELKKLFASYHLAGRAATDDDVIKQVNFFLDHVGDVSNEILFLDYEDGGNGLLTPTQAGLFLQTIKDRTNRPVGIYASDSIMNSLIPYIPDDSIIWDAEYGVRQPRKVTNANIWQFSETGKLPGEAGAFDMDYFIGDGLPGLYKLWNVDQPS